MTIDVTVLGLGIAGMCFGWFAAGIFAADFVLGPRRAPRRHRRPRTRPVPARREVDHDTVFLPRLR